MCDEKNDECLENQPDTQKIRIVKFDRAIPKIQLIVLSAVFLLLGVIFSPYLNTRIYIALCFVAMLAVIVLEVRKLFRKGLTLEIQYVDEEHPRRRALIAEEVPDPDEGALTDEISDNEETEKETHWTEQSYPDPDVELGLKPPPEASPEDEKR